MKNENKSFSSIKYEYIIGILGSETKFDLLFCYHYFAKRKTKIKFQVNWLTFRSYAPPLEVNVKKNLVKHTLYSNTELIFPLKVKTFQIICNIRWRSIETIILDQT